MRYLPAILVMAIIFILSNQPGDQISLPSFFGVDKICHAIAYATLAAAVIYAVLPSRLAHRKTSFNLFIIAFCIFYGITDEFHQSFVPNRSPSIFDVMADGFGAALTVFIWNFWQKDKVEVGN